MNRRGFLLFAGAAAFASKVPGLSAPVPLAELEEFEGVFEFLEPIETDEYYYVMYLHENMLDDIRALTGVTDVMRGGELGSVRNMRFIQSDVLSFAPMLRAARPHYRQLLRNRWER